MADSTVGALNYKTAASSVMTPIANTKRKEVLVRMPALVGEILEVSWDTTIKAAREKSAIAAPHWKKGDKVEEDNQADAQKYPTGSKRPGVYLVKSKKGVDTLTVKINITKSEGQEPEAKLLARFAGLRLEGKCPTGLGAHDVKVTIHELPNTLQHYEGDVSWRLETSKMSLPLANKTRLELFVVLDKPATFYKEGVWVEALRFVFKKAKVGGAKNPARIAARIARYCHTGHGMKYETEFGEAQFEALSIGGPNFKLLGYMAKKGKTGNVVNCYDQAAAVQALSGATGTKLGWVFLNPYGYINKTNLVGIGACNNPFFKGNGTKPVVDRLSADRTAFGNHAFIANGTKILDACAGPHLGTETLRAYMESAIDVEVTMKALGAPKAWKKADYWAYLEKLPNPLPGLTRVV